MGKEKPEYLYKYCTINRHTLNMILFNEAYFSLPKDFNDPFDCNIIPELIYTPEEQKKFIAKFKEERNGTEEKCLNLFKKTKETFEQEFRGTYENIRKKLRIFCLSAVNNNVMMYSHYADKHRGICLEFSVIKDPFFEVMDYVRYENKIPIFHPFSEDMNLILKELPIIEVLTKSCSWCYEEEWRIMKPGPNPDIHKFPSNILTSIIFGYRTQPTERLLIEKIIKDRAITVHLKEAIRKENSFELEIVPYKSKY